MLASGACLRMVSAAITPAGPFPMMTWFMLVPRWWKKMGDQIQLIALSLLLVLCLLCLLQRCGPQPFAGIACRNAFLAPAADFVILGQHLVETADLSLCRTGLGGFGLEPRRKIIVFFRQAGAEVEFLLHVPDTLANQISGYPATS